MAKDWLGSTPGEMRAEIARLSSKIDGLTEENKKLAAAAKESEKQIDELEDEVATLKDELYDAENRAAAAEKEDEDLDRSLLNLRLLHGMAASGDRERDIEETLTWATERVEVAARLEREVGPLERRLQALEESAEDFVATGVMGGSARRRY